MDFNALFQLFLHSVVPVLVALGLFKSAAKVASMTWEKFKSDAAKTKTKADDLLVHFADPIIQVGLRMLSEGDVAGAKAKIEEGVRKVKEMKKEASKAKPAATSV